jgi:excisionase family DNA binding protein
VQLNLDSYPDLLTVPEVAHILRVDRSYVYRLIRQHRLPILRPTPHKTRVLKSELQTFLHAARVDRDAFGKDKGFSTDSATFASSAG